MSPASSVSLTSRRATAPLLLLALLHLEARWLVSSYWPASTKRLLKLKSRQSRKKKKTPSSIYTGRNCLSMQAAPDFFKIK
ncbi:MAG: hypothetical protein ACK4PK_02475 [Alphaproteobacteria bacterium]